MFIPRHPVVENQFCKYGATSTPGGAGNVIAYAGSVVYLDADATNEESIVTKMVYAGTAFTPFGFLMQKVKTGYHTVHPVGMVLPGDLGSSDAIAQPVYDSTGAITGTDEVPTGVAHLGIWDTVHYTAKGTGTSATNITPVAAVKPGEAMYAANDNAKLTNNVTACADADDLTTGENVSTVVVARCVKGVSVAKATATIANTTLYPVRVKLMV